MNPPRCVKPRRINALSIAKLVKAMTDGAATVHELREACGLSLFTTRHYVLALHKEQACYVDHWEQDTRGRYVTAAYSLGSELDARKPKPDTAKRNRQYRTRQKQIEILLALAAPSLQAA